MGGGCLHCSPHGLFYGRGVGVQCCNAILAHGAQAWRQDCGCGTTVWLSHKLLLKPVTRGIGDAFSPNATTVGQKWKRFQTMYEYIYAGE